MKIYERKFKESSLSRIWQHINDDTKSFGVVSAFREYNIENVNLVKHESLRKEIRKLGYGYIEQLSGYSYAETGESFDEKSFFIPEISFDDVIKLGRKFDQESILYKSVELGFGVVMCDSKKFVMSFKKDNKSFTFSKDEVKKAYSQLIKANKSQRVKISYVAENSRVSRTEAYLYNYKGIKPEIKFQKFL